MWSENLFTWSVLEQWSYQRVTKWIRNNHLHFWQSLFRQGNAEYKTYKWLQGKKKEKEKEGATQQQAAVIALGR